MNKQHDTEDTRTTYETFRERQNMLWEQCHGVQPGPVMPATPPTAQDGMTGKGAPLLFRTRHVVECATMCAELLHRVLRADPL